MIFAFKDISVDHKPLKNRNFIYFLPSLISYISMKSVFNSCLWKKKCLYKLIKKKAHPGSHFFFFCSSSNNKDLSVKTVEVCVKQMKKLKQITIKLFHHGSTKEGMTILSRWKKAWKKSYSHNSSFNKNPIFKTTL